MRRVAYSWWQRGVEQRIWAEAGGAGAPATPGSLAEFLVSRHWGYNGKPGRRASAYQLRRPPWTLRAATDWGIEIECAAAGELYGDATAAIIRGEPASALLASGSRAQVFLPRRL